MYSVITKFTSILASLLLVSVSCSTESETARAARQLYEQAQSLNLDGDPAAALILLDSIQKTYPDEIDWQRASMKFRPTLIINDSNNRIKAVEDSIQLLGETYHLLLPKMKQINNKQLVEPYYVDAATYNPDFMKTTGVQPRVSEIGQFYFLSSVNGETLKHTGFTISVDGQSVQVGLVPYDNELNYRINGSEIITYSPDQSFAAGELVASNPTASVTIILTGSKNKTIRLNSKQIAAIANCFEFSRAIVDARQLSFEKERLQRVLEIANAQAEKLADSK